jgi:hypothetical protein
VTAFEFSIDAHWPRPPEKAVRDVAELRLSAGDQILTRLVDFERKEEREYVRSSAVSLAIWFADNWWRLRYESLRDGSVPSPDWRLRHELTSASGGTLWPPLMIHSTGDRVLLTPTYGRPLDEGTLRYLLPDVISLSGAGFEDGVDLFFAQVLERGAQALDGEVLMTLVQSLGNERSDPEIANWRRLEARLGFDPDTAPSALMRKLAGFESAIGLSGIDEAASAEPGMRSADALSKAIAASKESEIVVDLSVADGLSRSRLREGAAPPWQLGREAADQIRQKAGVRDGPIRSAAFSELFGARAEDLKRKRGTARGLPYAARLRVRRNTQQVALQSGDLRNRRFELACVLGDEVYSQANFGVVSKAKTDRQKFQRAFAQNLLAPYADVRRYVDPTDPSEEQMDRAADHFFVHRHVIKRLLILEGVLPEETFEERLEAA